MAVCIQCKKNYFNYDSDAGSFKELFCSEKCENENEKEIERYVENEIITRKDNRAQKAAPVNLKHCIFTGESYEQVCARIRDNKKYHRYFRRALCS